MKSTLRKKLVAIVVLVETLLLVGCAVYIFNLAQTNEQPVVEEKLVAKLTTQFDKQLEEAIEIGNRIEDDFKYVLLKADLYNDWEIVKWQEKVFGYQETSDGINIIVGNHEGTEYGTAFIWDAQNPEVIKMQVTSESIVLSQTGLQEMNYLKFEWYGRPYIMDHNLNVWRVVDEG